MPREARQLCASRIYAGAVSAGLRPVVPENAFGQAPARSNFLRGHGMPPPGIDQRTRFRNPQQIPAVWPGRGGMARVGGARATACGSPLRGDPLEPALCDRGLRFSRPVDYAFAVSLADGVTRTALEKGHDLEAQIEQYFTAHGYETARNLMLEGRSGGRHEIDVLVKKSDGITEFSAFVECKAWNHPIEKDIVSKVNYVVRDLGLSKGIIVSLEGWRVGAEQAAKELGIDLWDGYELEKRLGQVLVAELRGAGRRRRARGLLPVVEATQAESILNRQRSGVFGKEEMPWLGLVWLPLYLVELQLSNTEKRLFGRDHVKSTCILNAYEGFAGQWLATLVDDPALQEVESEDIIPAKVSDRKIATAIARECAHLQKLVSPNAIQRQQEKVRALGVPLPCRTVVVNSVTPVAWPYFVAFLQRKDKERIVAVNAVAANVSTAMSRVLTENVTYLREALET